MTEADLFSIPPEPEGGDAHWDRATARVLSTITRERRADHGWFIREPRQAWATAMIVAIVAALIVLAPEERHASPASITLSPADPLGRAFVASSTSPLVGSLLFDAGAR